MKSFIIILIMTVSGLVIGCSKQAGNGTGNPPVINCDGINAKFAADLLPIVQTKCAAEGGCHGSGSTNGPGALTNFNEIKNAAQSIESAVNSGRMPLNGSLNGTQLSQINCWVNNGALNN